MWRQFEGGDSKAQVCVASGDYSSAASDRGNTVYYNKYVNVLILPIWLTCGLAGYCFYVYTVFIRIVATATSLAWMWLLIEGSFY